MTTDGVGVSLEEALTVLEQLKLSTGREEAGCSKETGRSKPLPEVKETRGVEEEPEDRKFRRSRSFSNRNRRFAPYRTPLKRASSCGSKESEAESDADSNVSTKSSSSKEVLIPSARSATTCTQEALGIGKCSGSGESLDSLRQDAAVEELSEYFAHFVGVQSKMSSLAESMYA
ncbi:unnamed protein product [Bursaphelenchus xylophilus]|uniref:(pine wood nematode) hypothetical protein n=1 Tax=Bursaphelenchus xylophilus TaxID=6326 RepID=A0A1I7SAA9_BURXY|nr:unnamed protein product [Bursaphelenchus xylophilus]CAG9084119.1 unnamed protein product [Bursaphelenchus xylophilus]